ncbi:MAG TPA: DUF885 domain-containing protein [Acidimicrobiia bacterium]|nr:DUF885 domain-containing protein [Acidimicrobiia bacterium]
MATPFELSSRLVDDVADRFPLTGTILGARGVDHRWNDFSPDGTAAGLDLTRRYRAAFAEHLDHPDKWQRHAARVCHDRQVELEASHDQGARYLKLRHTAGFLEDVRDIFDQMDKSNDEGWANVASRLETVDQPVAGAIATFEEGRGRGQVVARRQAESVLQQTRHLAGEGSKWLGLARAAAEAASPLAARVAAAVDHGRGVMAGFADYVEGTYLPDANPVDGVGRERYVAAAERCLGAVIDPLETYDWGWEEVHRLNRAMKETAATIDPDLTLAGVIEMLETDPSYAASSQEEFVRFIQEIENQALTTLNGVHFEVPESIRSVSVNAVPPGAALGAYYLAPTEDFSRPGGIWYSFGDRQQIPLWGEVSTAYHEGFPGHHLQQGLLMMMSENLSRAQRLLIWYSGFSEGWALYTERLMDELGFFDQPHYLLGMQSGQQLRACRVVIDIGCHLGLRIPGTAEVAPGETWSYEAAVETLQRVAGLPPDVAHSEVKRYLGWPGQAISYKVGERAILGIREAEKKRQGASFDLRAFHQRLLGWGDIRLDYLAELTRGNGGPG